MEIRCESCGIAIDASAKAARDVGWAKLDGAWYCPAHVAQVAKAIAQGFGHALSHFMK